MNRVVLLLCFQKNQTSFVAWNNCYEENISSSAAVGDDRWNGLQKNGK